MCIAVRKDIRAGGIVIINPGISENKELKLSGAATLWVDCVVAFWAWTHLSTPLYGYITYYGVEVKKLLFAWGLLIGCTVTGGIAVNN